MGRDAVDGGEAGGRQHLGGRAAGDQPPGLEQRHPVAPARREPEVVERPVGGLSAQGYCLSSRLEHLSGRYAARFESDGASSTAAVVISGEPVAGELYTMRLSDCGDCAATGLVDDQEATLGTVPNVLSFAVTVGDETGTALLFGQPHAFAGSVTTAAGKFLGRLTLERLPPE